MATNIKIGDTVKIRGRGSRHEVLNVSLDNSSGYAKALLTWGRGDHCWWPVSELDIEARDQLGLFNV